MSMFEMRGSFIDNLPKIYGLYTGGFILFILLMAVFEQLGMSANTIGILFVGFTIVIYAVIGWLSRTMQVDAYYVAGRQVPAVFNGMRRRRTGCPAHPSSRWQAASTPGVMPTWPSWWDGPADMCWLRS